jgi:hypothetical protein
MQAVGRPYLVSIGATHSATSLTVPLVGAVEFPGKVELKGPGVPVELGRLPELEVENVLGRLPEFKVENVLGRLPELEVENVLEATAELERLSEFVELLLPGFCV